MDKLDKKREDDLKKSSADAPVAPRKKDWMKKLEAATGKPIQSWYNLGSVYLLVDCSGSMGGGKLQQAKNGSLGFAEEATGKGYSVGLIRFSSEAELVAEAQKQASSLSASIEGLSPTGSTNMTSAIELGRDRLVGAKGERVLCIVTDGMPNEPEAALDAARRAKSDGIDIMTIGTDDADRGFLEQLASRKELSMKVVKEQLETGIVSMAKMLPGKVE